MSNRKPSGNTKPRVRQRNASVSNEVTIDAKAPIPFENGQTFSVVNGHGYLPFLYPDDDFAKQLIEARLLSVTNDACIRTKKDFCAGVGFSDATGQDIPEEISSWLKSINRKGETARSLTRRAFEDFFTHGNVPIELVRFRVGSKPYFYVYVHNLLEWRLCKPNSDGDVTQAIRSRLFRKQGIVTNEQLKDSNPIPIYSTANSEKDNWLKDGDVERTMIWYHNQVTGFDHYGLPSNVASMIHQVLEYKGARYELDNFDNNLVVGGVLALKGELSQDEADRIGKQIIKTHTGDGKRGRVVVVASEEGIDNSAWHPMNTTKEGSFNEASDKWMQRIILANEWDAVLAGLVSPSTMGKGSGFITKIIELKLNTVIRPAQEDVMERVWNPIFTECEKWTNLPFSKYQIGIKNGIDISGLTDVDITPAVQVNEVRQAKGLPVDPSKDGVYMSAAKAGQQRAAEEGGGDV